MSEISFSHTADNLPAFTYLETISLNDPEAEKHLAAAFS